MGIRSLQRCVEGEVRDDPGTIRVNHAIHMKPIRRGPNGPNVQLECGDCHQAGGGYSGMEVCRRELHNGQH